MTQRPSNIVVVAYIFAALAALFWTLQTFWRLGQPYQLEDGDVVNSHYGVVSLNVYIPDPRRDELYQVVDVSLDDQEMRLVVDTSSADTFLASSLCNTLDTTSGCYQLETIYTDGTFIQDGIFDTLIGKGRVTGKLSNTTIGLNGLHVPNTTTALVESAPPDEFQYGFFSGYLALGMRTTSRIWLKYKRLPIIDTMISQRKLAKPMFSLFSPRLGDPQQKHGRLTLGGLDDRFTRPEITYGDVLPFARLSNFSQGEAELDNLQTYAWSTQLHRIRINGVTIEVSLGRLRRDGKHVSVIDSASSYIYFRTIDFHNIVKHFDGLTDVIPDSVGDIVRFECARAQLLELELLGKWFAVDPLDLLETNTRKIINGTEMCRSTIRSWDTMTFGDSLMGLPFMRSALTVFDYRSEDLFSVTPRLGLASTVDVEKALGRYKDMYST